MSGQGKPGYCKICDHPAARFLNARRERDGEEFNASKASALASELDPDFRFTRQTWYAHVKHITHPLVTRAKEAQNSPVIVPKTVTGGLEMIRDIGLKRVIENPDEVTVDHAIKALAELNKKTTTTDSVVVLIAKVLSGEQRAEEIVGEWTEVPPALEDKSLGS